MHRTTSLLVVLGVLASCSSGNVDESRRFQAQEAERTQLVPRVQETEIAKQFLKPTGTPVATMTPGALLSELVITSSLGADGEPTDDLERLSASSPSVSVAAQISDLQSGEIVTVQWLDEQGAIISAQDQEAVGSAGARWIGFTLPLSGSIPVGTYAAAVLVNGHLLDSIVFQIG